MAMPIDESDVLVAEDRLAAAMAHGSARDRAEARMLRRQAIERQNFRVRWEVLDDPTTLEVARLAEGDAAFEYEMALDSRQAVDNSSPRAIAAWHSLVAVKAAAWSRAKLHRRQLEVDPTDVITYVSGLESRGCVRKGCGKSKSEHEYGEFCP